MSSRLVFAAWFGLAAACLATLIAPGPLLGQDTSPGSLEGVPLPVDDNFEDSVREQLRDARAQVASILERETDPSRRGDALGQLGALYLLYDFMSSAQPLLEQAKELQPRDFRWPHFLALLQQFEGDAEAGLENARRATELKPDFLAAWIRRADFAYELGHPDEAQMAYEKAKSLGDPSGASLYGLGRLALDQGKGQLAVELFSRAIETQPPGSVIHYHLGVAYRQLGDLERARAEFAANERERVIYPDVLYDTLSTLNRSRESIFSRGVDALKRGQADLALEIFEELTTANPEDAEAHYNVGMALIEQGRKSKAEESLRRAIELREDYRDAQYNLGLVLGQRGAHAESEQAFRRVLQIDPEDLGSQVSLANAVAEQGRESEAVDMLREVLEVDAALAEARLLLGIVLARSGQSDEAARELRQILELAPGAPAERAEAHYHLALLADSEGTVEEARQHFLAAASLEITPSLREPLAAELAKKGEFGAASQLFEKLVQGRPDDGRLHLSRAMAYLLGGDERGARAALERSLERRPEDLVLRHLLARLLATAADDAVRDGSRALDLALAVMQESQTLEHGETVAMAFAERGVFEKAIEWQQTVLRLESEQGAVSPPRRRRLELYNSGKPVRTPWLDSR